MLTTRILRRIDEIPEATWDNLTQGHAFASHRWQRYGEAVMLNNDVRYVIVCDDDTPVAAATFCIIREEDLPITSPLLKRLVSWLIRRRPILACRASDASQTGIIVQDGPLKARAMEAILQAGEEIAAAFKSCAIVYDYLTPTPAIDWPVGYTRQNSPAPNTAMEIVWATHDEYLQSLPKKRRQDYKKYQAMKEELNITISVFDRVTDVQEALPLFYNLYNKYSLDDRARLTLQLESINLIDSHWIEARQAGKLVGGILITGDGDTANLKTIGRTYDIENLYFLLVDEAIRCAIEKGVKHLRAGSMIYEAKERRGFQRHEGDHVVIKTRLPLLKLVTKFSR
jgi:predicted N-acyltransferase